MHEGKEERKEEGTKLKFSRSIFSTVIRINGTLWVYIYLRIAKGYHV